MSTKTSHLRRSAWPLGRAWLAVLALALGASLAAGCKPRRATPTVDAGPVKTAPATPTPDPEPLPAARPPVAEAAPAASTFVQKRGELLDSDMQKLAADAIAALQKGDAAALAKVTAPGIDNAALAKKLRGRLGEGVPRFADAIVTPNLVELRYGLTYDVDASAPRYIQELHLMLLRVEGFNPWRLTDAFVPGL